MLSCCPHLRSAWCERKQPEQPSAGPLGSSHSDCHLDALRTPLLICTPYSLVSKRPGIYADNSHHFTRAPHREERPQRAPHSTWNCVSDVPAGGGSEQGCGELRTASVSPASMRWMLEESRGGEAIDSQRGNGSVTVGTPDVGQRASKAALPSPWEKGILRCTRRLVLSV